MSKVELSGSCLCGSVAYELSGESTAFNHCHCERCRKATGTGHASNIILTVSSMRWTSGEDLLGRYEVPEAKRFATVFCQHCGSLMPRLSPDGRIAARAGGIARYGPRNTPGAANISRSPGRVVLPGRRSPELRALRAHVLSHPPRGALDTAASNVGYDGPERSRVRGRVRRAGRN